MNSAEPLPCRHRGPAFVPGHFLCLSPRLVSAFGVTAEVCNQICPYRDHPENVGNAQVVQDVSGSGYGVAIGTYDTKHSGKGRYGVEAVELNLAVLRANCGPDIKVLVCDDGSPEASQRAYRKVCARYQAEFVSSSQRYGHTSGDIIVFWRAIQWAAKLGLRTVTKSSHRFMVDDPGWVQNDSERLIQSGFTTMTAPLSNFGEFTSIRTEGVMMVTQAWNRPEVLEMYRPKRYTIWNEGHTFHALRTRVAPEAPFPHYYPWARMSHHRGADVEPTYFHFMQGDPLQKFVALAEKYKVQLSEYFSVDDSSTSPDYKI